MKLKMIATAAAALALAAGAGGVHAATASAALYGLQYTLVDLDTTDGVTPWITFDTTSTFGATVAIAGSVYDFTTFLGSDSFATSAFGPASSSKAGAGATADAAIGGDATLAGVTLSAVSTSTAANGFSASTAGLGTDGSSVSFSGVSFTLSANTELIVTASADVSTSSDGTALGLADLKLFGADGSLLDETFGASYFGFSSGTLGIAFSNASDTETTGRLGALVSTLAQADAVPEPADTALMAAGLALLGFVVRRRNGAATQ